MKNLLMVLRLKDNARRIYTAPEGFVIPKGTILEVEFVGGTALGVAVTDSHEMDDAQETLTRELLHVDPNADFRKVVNVLNREAVQWPVDDPDPDENGDDAADDQDEDPEEDPEEDDAE